MNTDDPLHFRCSDYQKECPVSANRPPLEGVDYTDDDFQRLLTLKQWIYNVYPPEASFESTTTGNQVVWNVTGIPDNQYVSSALVTPTVTEDTLAFTNDAYLTLLQCRLHHATTPLPLAKIPDNFGGSILRPLDPYTSRSHFHDSLQMLAGHRFPPDDVRWSLFRGLHLHIPDAGTKSDAFDAITLPLYLDAKSHSTDDHKNEMTLELRLNLAAF